MAEIIKQFKLSETPFYLGRKDVKQTTSQEESNSAPLCELEIETLALEREKAREEGYKEGFKQGMDAGLAQVEQQTSKEASQALQQLQDLLQGLSEALAQSRQALKTEIADIVLAIVQQFFIHQQHSKEALGQQISAALQKLNDKQAITLVLHPQDLALLQQGKLKVDLSQCKDLRLSADKTLRLGGCLIKSEHGLFDASIERQIDRLKQVLLQIKSGDRHGSLA